MTYYDQLKQKFHDPKLLEQALTHRSWINENPKVRGNNERLEFLGDAILEFVVSEAIYTTLPDKEEGYLTSLRANLVNTTNLSKVAEKLELGSHLFMSKGEDDGGGRTNPSLLADTVESVIGAIFLDLGLDEAKKFIKENILTGLEEKISQPLKDPKSRLQELVQARGMSTPKYGVVSEEGPDHNKTFTVSVKVDNTVLGLGIGKSKSEAQQEAALAALALEPKKG